ncbi:MAG: hypothetical protein U9O20_02430 [Patescibacteria group bacterium]|nr:hypothetical protein [Patescibacteria group bacterium]
MTREVLDLLAIYGGQQYQLCDWVYASGIFLALCMFLVGMNFRIAWTEGMAVVRELPRLVLILGLIGILYSTPLSFSWPVFFSLHWLLSEIGRQGQAIISALLNIVAFVFLLSSFSLKRMRKT